LRSAPTSPSQSHVRTTLIGGPGDLSSFLQATGEANIVHLAGHCWWDEPGSPHPAASLAEIVRLYGIRNWIEQS
jgi:hypothetical protein